MNLDALGRLHAKQARNTVTDATLILNRSDGVSQTGDINFYGTVSGSTLRAMDGVDVYGDYLYTLYDQGFLTCHDAKTGEEIFGKQRFSPRGSFTASPFAYNGHLFFLSEDGLTYVMKAGSNFEIMGQNDLEALEKMKAILSSKKSARPIVIKDKINIILQRY